MSDEKQDTSINWIYEGPKSLVNREDYLLGKRIDRNFELYSDVVIKNNTEENTELFANKNSLLKPDLSSKTTVLDLNVVRTEDPLVAIKLQQEQKKRNLLENPLIKLKAQRVLREAYEKEFGSSKKKASKKHKKRSSSSTSSEKETKKKQKKKVKYDQQISQNYKKSHDNLDKKKSYHNFIDENKKHRRREIEKTDSDKIYQEPSTLSTSNTKSQLSAKEMEEKRQAMMANAKWRNEVHEESIRKANIKLKAEEEELEKTQLNAIRPRIDSITTATSSITERLQSKKHSLQRSHDYMEKSFAKK